MFVCSCSQANAQLTVQHTARGKLESQLAAVQQQVAVLQRQLRESQLELTETKKLMTSQASFVVFTYGRHHHKEHHHHHHYYRNCYQHRLRDLHEIYMLLTC